MKKLSCALALTVALLNVNVTAAFAENGTSKEAKQQQTLEKLKDKSENKDLKVQWDKDNNNPNFISGKIEDSSVKTQGEAKNFLEDIKKIFKIENGEFKVKKEVADELGKKHYDAILEVDGIPVYGSEVKVHTNEDGQVYAVNGSPKTEVEAIKWSKKVKINSKKAIELAEKSLDSKVDKDSYVEAPTSNLYLYNFDGKNYVVYLVNLKFVKPEVTDKYLFINAENGNLVDQFGSAKNVEGPATGSGLDVKGNQVRLNTYYNGQAYELRDKRANGVEIVTKDLHHSNDYYSMNETVVTDQDNYFSDNEQKAAVSAHYNTGRAYDYFNNVFKRNSIDGRGGALTASVHFSNNYNNAYNLGMRMVYGDGDGVRFSNFADALDVVAHEYTHGITAYTSGLEYRNQSGALNEAMSDILGTACEAYYKGEQGSNWLMGEDCYTPRIAGDGLRSMENPRQNGDPDHMNYYLNTTEDDGGVHTNSSIINKAAYNIGSVIGKAEMGKLFYRANTVYFTTTTNFDGARNGVLQAAQDFYGKDSDKYKLVMNAFAAVGIGEPAPKEEKKEETNQDNNTTNNNTSDNTTKTKEVVGWNYENQIIESPHNYPNNSNTVKTYKKDGASVKAVALHFSKVQLENYGDYIYILDDKGYVIETITGTRENFWVTVPGNVAKINMVTDEAITYYGYTVDQVAYYLDQVDEPKNDTVKAKGNIGWNYEYIGIESLHPYRGNTNDLKYYKKPGENVTKVALHFSQLQTESYVDFIKVLDSKGNVVRNLTGYGRDFWVTVEGNEAYINTVTNNYINYYGYKIDRVAYYLDSL